MAFLARLLLPSGEEIAELARRETDPRHAAEFEQLCPGPILAALGLCAVGVLAVLVSPYRLLARMRNRRR